MTVHLRASTALGDVPSFADWVSIPSDDSGPPPLDPARARRDIAAALETAFDEIAADWWALGKSLSDDASAGLAHTPACVANASDFGLMLAWTRLVKTWAATESVTLVVCDDPWMFRHLAGLPRVTAGTAPALWLKSLRLALRGFAARSAVAVRVVQWAISAASQRKQAAKREATLLVYGHPASTADGQDGYFGDLMQTHPALSRILHVDCDLDRANILAQDRRTISLHAFSAPLHALALPFARWRPSRHRLVGPNGWLVRRAAAREGSTGQAATIRWQQICQERWLETCRPSVVAWPWENHSWERSFVRKARALGIATVGYQHSVIGRRMLNYAPASNPDGPGSLPDRILCTGGATRDQLISWGIPESRLQIGGALRFPVLRAPALDSAAPVFMALPFDGITAAEMVSAAKAAATHGYRFLIKDHPMTPFAVEATPGVEPTAKPLAEHASVSAVVYAATTVGLEAILAGLPTLRFRPRNRIALDILPSGITIPAVDSETLADALADPPRAPSLAREFVFGAVDRNLWRKVLQPSPT